MKVYCNDCKWYKDNSFKNSGYYNIKNECNHPTNKETVDHYDKVYYQYTESPDTLNSNNQCKNYKKSLPVFEILLISIIISIIIVILV